VNCNKSAISVEQICHLSIEFKVIQNKRYVISLSLLQFTMFLNLQIKVALYLFLFGIRRRLT
jgi:hypothetical protein